MGLLYNRVRETSTTTGTGDLTLAGAVTGFHAFNDKVATGTTVRYVIAHQSANEHEYGIGTFTATSTLARTVVLGGSNGTSAVNLSAGTKDVFVDALAEDFESVVLITGRITGRYYVGGYFSTGGSAGALTLGTLYATPFLVGPRSSFDGIGVVCASGISSSTARLGIYRDEAGRPGTLIVDAGTVSGATSGNKLASITQTLQGLVWLAGVGQGVAPSLTRHAWFSTPWMGSADPFSVGGVCMAYAQTGISGALPDPWGSTYTQIGTTNTVPWLYLRAA